MKYTYLLRQVHLWKDIPQLYRDGKKVRKYMPEHPEASDPTGIENMDSHTTLSTLCIGESTMAGVGVDYHKDGFARYFAKNISDYTQCNVSWNVYAKKGYTAQEVLEQLLPQITETVVDYIAIGLGGNDSFQLSDPRLWTKSIHDIISYLKNRFPAAHIIFLQIPPVKQFPIFTPLMQKILGDHADKLDETLYDIVEDYQNVHFIKGSLNADSLSKYSSDGNMDVKDFFSDGVHPSSLSYQIWASIIVDYLISKGVFKDAIEKRIQLNDSYQFDKNDTQFK